MPIEVRELHIRVAVNEPQAGSAGETTHGDLPVVKTLEKAPGVINTVLLDGSVREVSPQAAEGSFFAYDDAFVDRICVPTSASGAGFAGGVSVAVGDLDGDAARDIGDLNDWRANYGVGAAPAAAEKMSFDLHLESSEVEAGAGKADFKEFNVLKTTDSASRGTNAALGDGSVRPDAEMSDTREVYLQIEMKDVLVSGWSTSAANTPDITTVDRTIAIDKAAIDVLIAEVPERLSESGGANLLLADGSVRFDAFDPQFTGGVFVGAGDVGDLGIWQENYGVGPAATTEGSAIYKMHNIGFTAANTYQGTTEVRDGILHIDTAPSLGFDLM